MKILAVLIVSCALAVAANCDEWPDFGKTSGGFGEVEEHFTDSVFDTQNSGNVAEAAAMMGNATEEQSEASRSVKPSAALGEATSSDVPASAAGSWRLELTDDTSIDLVLHQSGSVVFGSGKVSKGINSTTATASGAISGPTLNLDIVTALGDELYSISLDFAALPATGTYNLFRPGLAPESGIARAT